MRVTMVLVAAPLALQGCGLGDEIGSWRDAAYGLVTEDAWSPLEEVLETAEDTPGNQGLLYVAIKDAEVAAQSATRAVAAGSDGAAIDAIGEVVYALAPEAAPGWDVKGSGLIPGWTGTGYGLVRSGEEMQAALRAAAGEDGAAIGDATTCVENTTARARETLDLAQSLLDDTAAARRAADLPQLERLARGLLAGLDVDGDGTVAIREGECGLTAAERILDPLAPRDRF